MSTTRAWLRMGRQARPGAAAAIWPVVLAVATVVIIAVATALTAAVAVYDGRDVREAARTPVIAPDDVDAELLWLDTHDSVGLRDATVISLVPLREDAPLPPGVPRWPAEGEALLSPALAAAGSSEGIASRYGRVIGVVGAEGLASPTELLAYVRPPLADVVDVDVMLRVSGFGEPVAYGLIGEAADVQPLRNLLALMAVALGAATLLVIGVAVRAGQVERQRQAVILDMLGARRTERWLWAWGAVARPVSLGITIATAAVAGLFVRDWTLPGRGYVIRADDMRAAAGPLLATAAVAALVVVGMSILAARPRAAAAARPRPAVPAWPRWRALVCAAGAPVAVAAVLTVRHGGSVVALMVYFGAVIVTVSQLPALVGYLTVRAARALRRRGERSASPDELVAGAGLVHDARAVVRFASLIAVAMVIFTQAQSYLALGSDTVRDAAAVRAAVDGRFVSVLSFPGTEAAWPQVAADLRSELGLSTVWVVESFDPDGEVSTSVHGSSDDLALLGIADQATTLDLESIPGRAGLALRYNSSARQVDVVRADAADWIQADGAGDRQGTGLVFSPDMAQIDLPAVKSTVYAVATPTWRVEYPGDVWLLGNLLGRHQAGWVGWFGAIGVTLLAVGACGGAADDIRRSAARLAPLSSLYARPGITRRIVAWRLAVPLAVALVCGAVISLMLGSVLRVGTGTAVDLVPLLLGIGFAVALTGAGVWWLAVLSLRHATTRWDGRGASE
ncbi:hypothetical protein [Cellulomonas sp. IC4_254]|uniref:hypothetical protein n=1 Tax=Cellulomonas sp. IC4_254 TaxID=2714040 RepID=UPI00141EBF92|nr:hypothetical protein [Cellulomonas sp. IC4_254]NHT17225.1 hypothetical protein [Cellulomonas sp. IC4_254]